MDKHKSEFSRYFFGPLLQGNLAPQRTPASFWTPMISSVLLVIALMGQPAVCSTASKSPDKSKERDAWQHPLEVMDALGIKPGSIVGDVGCGEGYFTFHLASRVGAEGKVYAVDIDKKVLKKVHRRARKEHLAQIETALGNRDDPRLPAGILDAILVMDAFHEMDKYDAMLQAMYRALKPGGFLGIIDRKADPGQPRSTYFEHHRIPQPLVEEDVARNGFQLLRREQGFTNPTRNVEYFFLIFQKP